MGDHFVLNCLGEGEYSATMKHFLQRFPAGADRFEGVDWAPSATGAPVLRSAIAYIDCKVPLGWAGLGALLAGWVVLLACGWMGTA